MRIQDEISPYHLIIKIPLQRYPSSVPVRIELDISITKKPSLSEGFSYD